ncbi:MAG: hypothetical protein ABSG05_00595 [Candidatus Pacearchaeota archaeon]|jgi:uncharacterized membrane protein YgcG
MCRLKLFFIGLIFSLFGILFIVQLVSATGPNIFPGIFYDNVTNITITIGQNNSITNFYMNTSNSYFDNQSIVFSTNSGSATQKFTVSSMLGSVDGQVSIQKGMQIPKFLSMNLHPLSPWDAYLPEALSGYNLTISQINNDCITNNCSIFNQYLINDNIIIPSKTNLIFTKNSTNYSFANDYGYDNISSYQSSISQIITDSIMQMNISNIISDMLPMITNNLTYYNVDVSQLLLSAINSNYRVSYINLSKINFKNGSYTIPITIANGTNSIIKNILVKLQDISNTTQIADTTPPVITVISPNNNELFNVSNVTLDINTSEDASGWYNLNGTNVSMTRTSPTSFENDLSLSDGNYVVIFYAEDLSGNIGQTTTNFNINTTIISSNNIGTNNNSNSSNNGNNGGSSGGDSNGGSSGGGGGGGGSSGGHSSYVNTPLSNSLPNQNANPQTGTITAQATAPLNSKNSSFDITGVLVILGIFAGLGIFLAIITFSLNHKKIRNEKL